MNRFEVIYYDGDTFIADGQELVLKLVAETWSTQQVRDYVNRLNQKYEEESNG